MRHSFIVFTKAQPGREADFNAWYEDIHVGDVLAVPGIVACHRYRLVPKPDGATPDWTFAAIYELETGDPQAVLAEVSRRASSGEMVMSPHGVPGTTLTLLGEPISSHGRR